MKKLEELGISPAPWRICDERCLDGSIVGVESSDKKSDLVAGDIVITEANARLIAAAPELYDAGQKTEAVLTGLFKLDEFAALLKSGAADALIACRDELRKALAKASGEEADNG